MRKFLRQANMVQLIIHRYPQPPPHTLISN
jgi:hypothetical protein